MKSRFLLLLWFLSAAATADTGYATREIELRAQPVAGSQVVGTLPKGARFEIVGESKAWAQVKSDKATGWTLLFYVMKGDPPQGATAGRTMSELWNLGTDRDKGQITSTIGVRGIDEEQLKAAHFDAQELKRLEAQLVQPQAAEAFAQTGGLSPRKVDYLPGTAQ